VTLGLFHAVGAWNSYFSAILYMNKRSGWPLQLVLRELIMQSGINEVQNASDDVQTIPFTLQMAAIMVTTLPIMCVYPFLQKYFMKGLLLGGVKE
jgi:putative aldouronate transport system permease protein